MKYKPPTEKLSPEEFKQHLILWKQNDKFIRDGEKTSLLLTMVFLGGPFILLLPYLARSERNASLWPLLVILVINGLWALYVAVKHQTISQKDFYALPIEERSVRRLYDSMWFHFYSGVWILFTSIILIWGLLEIYLYVGVDILLIILVAGCIIFCLVLCILNVNWIAKVLVEGVNVHPWLKPVGVALSVIIGSMTMMSGFGRLSQVFFGIEETKWAFLPILSIAAWALTMTMAIGGLYFLKIASVQREFWQRENI